MMFSITGIAFIILILAVAAVFPRLFVGLLKVFAGLRAPAPASAKWLAGLATLFLLGIVASAVGTVLFLIDARDLRLVLVALPALFPASFLGLCLLISTQRIADAIERRKDESPKTDSSSDES